MKFESEIPGAHVILTRFGRRSHMQPYGGALSTSQRAVRKDYVCTTDCVAHRQTVRQPDSGLSGLLIKQCSTLNSEFSKLFITL